jgi:hypothetical protein
MLNVDEGTCESLLDERRAIEEAMRKPGLASRERAELEERLSDNESLVGIAQVLAKNELEMALEEFERSAARESRGPSWMWYAAVALAAVVIYRTLKWLLKG